MKGNRENIITLAHQTEAMSRQKRLKPLEDYLSRRRKSGTDPGVFGFFKSLEARGMITIAEKEG